MSNILSYKNILNDIANFRSSGSKYGNEFNIYDTPTHKYFRLLFYFGSSTEDNEVNYGAGLLAPTWELYKTKNGENASVNSVPYYMHNSAWSYLKLNDENERAEKLQQFVTLLSDINSKSPWYFSSLGGLQEALERKVTEDGKLEIADKKLTITCLPDAFDNRIGTLLELYRDVTWSWANKKEIIPANLRKFDMAVYIFEAPERTWHTINKDNDMFIGKNNKDYSNETWLPSYKMIEFHDCEFNYNSVKSGWSELNNQTGFAPTYQIEITYSDAYEVAYNDIMLRTIGDVITTDMLDSASDDLYISLPQEDIHALKETLKAKTNIYDGFLDTVMSQVAGHFISDVKDLVNQKLMGNIFGLSITGLADNVNDLMQGNLIKTGMSAAQFIREQKNNYKDKHKGKAEGNIYEGNKAATDNIGRKPIDSKTLGNIFSSSTIANNI